MMMNVLIVGSGGREHAFTWKASQSDLVEKIFVAPGNAGTSLEPKAENINISASNIDALVSFSKKENIDLLIVGPEDPLVNGITDKFKNAGIRCFGPESLGAKLEGSKDFAKAFMKRHNIPTASYESFTNADEAKKYIQENELPQVIKADGLAAGKGVVIAEDYETAFETIDEFISETKYGDASRKIIIEDFLEGQELSYIVMVNGTEYLPLATSQDHKTIGEGDVGLNTGGMGAISPVPFVTPEFEEKIHQRIVLPTIAGFQEQNLPFVGFVFIGLIKVGDDPYVIEYNVRMGDPETEVVLPRVKNDFVALLLATAKGELNTIDLQLDERSATTVMLVSGGYPEAYEKGKAMKGLAKESESILFHAGTQLAEEETLTSGGRVLAVTSYGSDFRAALKQSYATIEGISFEGMNYRKDLGFDL